MNREEEIRHRAYQIYKWRLCNNVEGDELSDWYQAVDMWECDNIINERFLHGYILGEV